jgi:hypothetical protein
MMTMFSRSRARHVGANALTILCLLTVAACKDDTNDDRAATLAGSPAASVPALSTEQALRIVAERRVYFAHQSVGGNLVEGLDSILSGRGTTLRVVKTSEPSSISGPAFVHFDAGRNEDPASKNADFLRVLDSRETRDSAIALLKYCYVDVNLGTDIESLFEGYRRTIAQVKERHPDVTVVHVTMPLTTDATGAKSTIKHLLGRPTARDVNAKRSHFNAMLRKEFGNEPIFDLAGLESTRPDGSREVATINGEAVYALVPDYSYDGRHLNSEAQRRFADRLVKTLASSRRQ